MRDVESADRTAPGVEPNAWRTFVLVVALLVLAESAVMLLLPHIAPGLTGMREALLDSVMLVVIASPFLWLLLVRPLRRRTTIERRQFERELAFQKYALDQHALVAMTDPRGVIIYVNDRFCEASGYAREELVGRTHRVVKSGQHSDAFYEDMWSRIQHGEVWHGEICNRAKDGTLYWLDSTIVPFQTRTGELVRYVAIRTDISRRRKAEEELRAQAIALREARDLAEAATHAKSQFLATMSHEIRTPMNGVLGMAELLLAGDLNDDQRESVEVLQSSGRILLALVNDVLDFSKIEAGHLPLEEIPYDLRALIEELLALLRPQAVERGLELSLDLNWPTLPPLVLGDPGKMRQVLLNLLGNALKFTEAGHVHVRAERLDEHRMRLLVEDTGPGIAEDRQTYLFEAFTQADASTTRRFGGTGLGLAICRRLVEGMGGEIGVRSAAGEGATFHVTLPVRSAPEAGPTATPRPPAQLARSAGLERSALRVLVAEDNGVNRIVSKRMLLALGCEVDLCVNGLEAVEMCAAVSYDLVFMDCSMPVLDGYEATARLRARPSAGRLPIIVALTASALEDDRERCLAAGMDDYLSKPVSMQDFEKLLQRWQQA